MDEKELKTIPFVVFKVLEAKYQKRIKTLLWALLATHLFYIILFLCG
ncbi:MAG: hypothetical protein J6Q10_01265 [Clostridia bacterium]|nr:hypothetical protein [Clostridia bacterium]